LGTGTISKAQGGKFTTGALLGGLGQAGSEALTEAAPGAAESALDIRRLDRAYGKTPGEATIAETAGIAPETVAASADQQIQNLQSQLMAAARRAEGRASVQPAMKLITKSGLQSAAIIRPHWSHYKN